MLLKILGLNSSKTYIYQRYWGLIVVKHIFTVIYEI